MRQSKTMSDDLNHLSEPELKRRIFGTFSMSDQPPAPPTSDISPIVDDEQLALASTGGGSILICKQCGCLLPVCESRIDMLVRHAGLEQRPAGRFYFTSEICFMCSEQAAIFVPPVTLVRVAGNPSSERSKQPETTHE